MFQSIIYFGLFYLLIGTLLLSRALTRREFEDMSEVNSFSLSYLLLWPIYLCVAAAFSMAEFFSEKDE